MFLVCYSRFSFVEFLGGAILFASTVEGFQIVADGEGLKIVFSVGGDEDASADDRMGLSLGGHSDEGLDGLARNILQFSKQLRNTEWLLGYGYDLLNHVSDYSSAICSI